MNKLTTIKLPKTYTELLQWVSYLWAGTICFPALQGTFYGVFVLLLWGVFKGHIGFSFKNKTTENAKKSPLGGFRGSKTPFYFLLAYVLWMTVTILWSDDIREYFRQFEKLIPLYLLAFIGFMEGINKHININKVLNAFLWGVLIAIAYMVVRMGVDMFVGDMIGQVKTQGFLSLNLFDDFNHYTYIGITLVMAIPLLLEQMKSKVLVGRIISITLIGFIVLLCIMSGGRLVMGLSVVVLVSSFYMLYSRKLSLFFRILSVCTLVLIGVFSIIQTNRIQSIVHQLSVNDEMKRVEVRTALWPSVIGAIYDNFLFGCGMGDMGDVLIEEYQKNNLTIAIDRNLNAHNQYLQTLLGGGIVALLLLTLFFVSILRSQSLRRDPFSTSFMFVWFVTFIFESILLRNIGVFPLIFFVTMILWHVVSKPRVVEITYAYNLVSGFAFILFLILALIALLIPMSSSNPRTYMTGDYEYIEWKDMPSRGKLPDYTNAIKLTTQNIIDNGKEDYYQYFYLMRKDLGNDTLNVSVKIDYYIENADNFESISVIIQHSQGANDELIVKDIKDYGGWQQLEITSDVSNFTQIHVMTVLNKERANNLGALYYALPEIKVMKHNE